MEIKYATYDRLRDLRHLGWTVQGWTSPREGVCSECLSVHQEVLPFSELAGYLDLDERSAGKQPGKGKW